MRKRWSISLGFLLIMGLFLSSCGTTSYVKEEPGITLKETEKVEAK
jgi:uncharacterized protein YneF (UPF0154 family)